MWPFKKRIPREIYTKTEEVVVDKILGSDFHIKIIIESWSDNPDRWIVGIVFSEYGKMYFRQPFLEKHRAIKIAQAFTSALELTYDMALEQEVCDLD